MSNARKLAVRLAPKDDESFRSYVERLAARHEVSLLVMLKFLRLIGAERYQQINGYGIYLDPKRLEEFCFVTSIPKERASRMLLSTYHGSAIDLSGLDITDSDSLRRISVEQWAYFSGSHVCPRCLEDNSGAWKLSWKLPWSFVCVTHRCYLIDVCPSCKKRIAEGRRDHSLSPVFVSKVPAPGFCSNPRAEGNTLAGNGATPCGYQLSAISTEKADLRTIDNQKKILAALSGSPPPVAGTTVSAITFFQILRSLCAFTLYCADVSDLGDIPKNEMQAFAAFAASRNEKLLLQSESLQPRNEARSRYWRGVPTDPYLMAALVNSALKIVGAANIVEMGTAMSPFIERSKDRTPKARWKIPEQFRFHPLLAEAFHSNMSRTSHFDRSIGNRSLHQNSFPYNFEPRHVPQLIWKEDYEKSFKNFFPMMHENSARRYCAMSLARLCSYLSWTKTTELLDLPLSNASGMANRAIVLLNQQGDSQLFSKALHELATRLSNDAVKVDYQNRRKMLSNLTDIPWEQWKKICAASHVIPGHIGGRSRYAAAWLWAELTCGDWKLAPALKDGNKLNVREVYRQNEKKLFPLVKTALLDYGKRRYGCGIGPREGADR
jgi:hypothetical protein